MPEVPKDEFRPGIGKEIAGSPGAIEAQGVSMEPPIDPAGEEVVETSDSPIANFDLARFVATAGILAYISSVAVSAEYSGNNDVLPKIPELVATSMGHPALGYIGGGAAGIATLKKSPAVHTTAILAAATAANFLTEKAQSIAVSSPEFADFMSRQNLPETGKDYLFALLGAGLFILQQRRQNR